MLDALFDERVSVRRVTTMSATGVVDYQELVDSGGGPLLIKCKIQRRRRRITNKQGQEIEVDGTMMCRRTRPNGVILQVDDIIVSVDPDNDQQEAYKLLTLDEDQGLLDQQKYQRITLQKTNLPVQPNLPT